MNKQGNLLNFISGNNVRNVLGDWGLGIGDWPNPQSPIPNPQSPCII